MKKVLTSVQLPYLYFYSFSMQHPARLFIFLCLFQLLGSCSKDESENPLSGKIYRIIANPGTSYTDTTQFNYDENNRIISVSQQRSLFNTTQTLIYERNSSGQVTALVQKLPGAYCPVMNIKYKLGPTGRYISAEINTSHAGTPYQYKEEYFYTGENITQTNSYLSDIYNSKTLYSYDEKGNVISFQQYDAADSLFLKIEYAYDQVNNPVVSFKDPFSLQFIYLSGINNLVAEKYYETEYAVYILHTYTYDDLGKPLTDMGGLSYDSITCVDGRFHQYIYH